MKWYTVRQVSEMLGVSFMAIHRRIKNKQIKAEMTTTKTGREYAISEEALKEYFKEQKQTTGITEVALIKNEVPAEQIIEPIKDLTLITKSLLQEMARQTETIKQLMEKVERLEKQNRRKNPRIWSGKKRV